MTSELLSAIAPLVLISAAFWGNALLTSRELLKREQELRAEVESSGLTVAPTGAQLSLPDLTLSVPHVLGAGSPRQTRVSLRKARNVLTWKFNEREIVSAEFAVRVFQKDRTVALFATRAGDYHCRLQPRFSWMGRIQKGPTWADNYECSDNGFIFTHPGLADFLQEQCTVVPDPQGFFESFRDVSGTVPRWGLQFVDGWLVVWRTGSRWLSFDELRARAESITQAL